MDWTNKTTLQINTWRVMCHGLSFDKPFTDFYIEDKAISDRDFDWKIY
jgi:hypothetical protein